VLRADERIHFEQGGIFDPRIHRFDEFGLVRAVGDALPDAHVAEDGVWNRKSRERSVERFWAFYGDDVSG
jgi:hypothetical protein